MIDLFLDSLLDAFLDTLRILPFLFLTYLAMEWLEHRAENPMRLAIRNGGRIGPLIGAALGVVPQCGFSATASGLFAGGVISLGTLLAVFLSTSDEMLPLLLTAGAGIRMILVILGIKALYAMAAGFLVDLAYRKVRPVHMGEEFSVAKLCEEEHCGCDKDLLRSALHHTATVTAAIFVVSVLLTLGINVIGEETLGGVFLGHRLLAPFLAGLVGLIPNCASSVVLTELYLEGLLSVDAMLAGLFVNAGVGLIVLFQTARPIRRNIAVTALLYALGVTGGVLIGFLPLGGLL